MKSALLRLFKALPVEEHGEYPIHIECHNAILKDTIKYSFILSPEIIEAYQEDLPATIQLVAKEVGLSGSQMNNSFHKSWKKVQDASIEQLVIEQIVHYFTTYGFKELGIYDKETVYIPNETLEIPDIELDTIPLIVIRGLTKDEIKVKLLSLLQSGVALHEDTLKDIAKIAKFVALNATEIETIKNKEILCMLYKQLNIIPENPIEFLRYLLYITTGKTLLIKDPETIELIQEGEKHPITSLFGKYEKEYGLQRLAEIFYRFKLLFLAFRTNKAVRPTINKIRRLAKKYHKPMPEDLLNVVTAKLQQGKLYEAELEKALSKANIFRKIRLAYALKYRTKDVRSILYRIRNGKGFAKDFHFAQKRNAEQVLDIVVNSIVKDLRPKVEGKEIYIPEHIKYTLPATEKQFSGNFPSGSYVSVPKDMVFGVHWENVDNNQIDLDLALVSMDGKIGWDGAYRTEDRGVLFSGDLTDAPKSRGGASELFYVAKQELSTYLVTLNFYNYQKDVEVPFKIFVAQEKVKNLKGNYTVDPNNVVATTDTKIQKQQMVIGIVVTTTDHCKFYFAESVVGRGISSSESEVTDRIRKYLFNFYTNTLDLGKVLERADAEIVTDLTKDSIDLSPEALEKDTILNLLIK